MKQTAMQKLLSQLRYERRNIPMSIEWDRCYQAIETVIKNTYLQEEKKQIIEAVGAPISGEKYYNETYKSN